MKKPESSARAVVLSALLLVVVGSCGAANGIGGLSSEAVPPAATLGEEGIAEVAEAREAAARALAETLYRAPMRRALAGANVVVSTLLVVGGLLLLFRRRAAVWWVTQATLANALWSLGHGGSQLHRMWSSQAELVEVFDREIEARLSAQGSTGEEVPIGGDHYLFLVLAGIVGYALVWVGIYAWIAYRVRRPDIGELLAAAERERG